jgi:hypothetical protein
MNCFQCGREVEVEDKVFRKDACPSCHAALHCCRNCRFYDRNAHNACREPAAEWVSGKEAANFCEFFEPGEGGGEHPSAGSGRDAFERLFRK